MSQELSEIVIVPHSHTDYGFTNDQHIVDLLHVDFLNDAIELCEADLDAAPGEGFCWTVETCGMMRDWLHRAKDRDIDRLRALDAAGKIEIAAMPFHVTPLADATDLKDLLRLPVWLRDQFGFRITSAMDSDVNGQNWPLVEELLDIGVDGFSMAINTHFGRAPLHRPNVFWWEGSSGRRIRAFNGFPYGMDLKLKLNVEELVQFETIWLPKLRKRLEASSYAAPVLLIQAIAPYGDNGPPDAEVARFARTWNASGRSPKMTVGTLRTFWDKIKAYGAGLPVVRGDWSDSWNFGCLVTARAVSVQRASRARIRATETLLEKLPQQAVAKITPILDDAKASYHRFHEHTWGADCTVLAPWAEDSWSQSIHKANLAATARSLSLYAQREALGELSQTLTPASAEQILVVNPLPFDRTITGIVTGGVAQARGRATDKRSARHAQDRRMDYDPIAGDKPPYDEWGQDPRNILKPTLVAANSFVVLDKADSLVDPYLSAQFSQEAVVESERYRLEIDVVKGGVHSWFDKRLGREILSPKSLTPGLGYAYERVISEAENPRHELFKMEWGSPEIEIPDGWNPGWRAERLGGGAVRKHRVFVNGLGTEVRQAWDVPGAVGPLEWVLWIPAYAEWIELRTSWICGVDPHPASQYLTFPFSIPESQVRLDLGGGVSIRPGKDQIPGVQMDYFTVQHWVDFTSGDGSFGITVATPENPMVQLGGFRFGENAKEFTLPEPTMLGWVTSNYWETNFSPIQPGKVTARYRFLPHKGPLDPAAADRFGLDALFADPLIQQMGESRG